jgi:hypothetical protein
MTYAARAYDHAIDCSTDVTSLPAIQRSDQTDVVGRHSTHLFY